MADELPDPSVRAESKSSAWMRSIRPDQPWMRWAWIIVGTLVVLPLLALGTFQIVTLLAHDEETTVQTFDGAGIATLDVSVGIGGVTIIGTDHDEITVTVHINNGLTKTRHSEQVVGDTLKLHADCQHFVSKFCSVDYTIEMPRDIRVIAGSDNSRIQLVELTGDVTARTDNGSIDARSLSGSVDLRSDNGSIIAELASSEVRATTDNGSIRLTLTKPPDNVYVASDNGSVTVVVPDTAETYATDLSADNGSVNDDVRTDPASPRTITGRTDNGSITVRYPN